MAGLALDERERRWMSALYDRIGVVCPKAQHTLPGGGREGTLGMEHLRGVRGVFLAHLEVHISMLIENQTCHNVIGFPDFPDVPLFGSCAGVMTLEEGGRGARRRKERRPQKGWYDTRGSCPHL